MLNMMVDGFRTSPHEEDKLEYAKDIAALERVLRLYTTTIRPGSRSCWTKV